jgi:hypothetical protein
MKKTQKEIKKYLPKLISNISKDIQKYKEYETQIIIKEKETQIITKEKEYKNTLEQEDEDLKIYEEMKIFINSNLLLNYLESFVKIVVCISGGAEGADYYWIQNALKQSHFGVVMSFKGHTLNLPKFSKNSLKILELNNDKIQEAIFFLKKANESLKRNINFHQNFLISLLCRNYYQIKFVNSVYVVGYFENSQRENLKKVNIKGGTAWAVQMFIDQIIISQTVPLYFFCQDSNTWLNCSVIFKNSEKIINWKKIYSIPKPKNLYAAIGSRDLTEEGKKIIKNTFI